MKAAKIWASVSAIALIMSAGAALADLRPMAPVLLGYVLSFVYVGIYWNNHHHLLHAVSSVNGPILWANLHLLFWLSVVPLATAWMGEHPWAKAPTAAYGVVLLMNAIAFSILSALLLRHEGPDSKLAKAFGRDYKGKTSLAFYVLAIAAAPFAPVISVILYVTVAAIWFVPDRRIERALGMAPGA